MKKSNHKEGYPMDKVYEKLQSCLADVRRHTDFVPDVALVLGSGLGGFAEEIDAVRSVPYADIAGFPVSTVPGHQGRFVFGHLDGVKIVAMQGRVHYYEGYSVQDVVLPVRLMGLLGAKALFLTNAAGGVDPAFNAGDFMLITDQIMSFFPNPLIGENADELGTRFPDMSQIYDAELCGRVRAKAGALGIPLREGVYLQFTGPSFETPAEIRMASLFGASAVGMSTACEAVAARHMGLRVCGISCIANKAAGHTDGLLTHEEVQETADRVAPLFKKLLRGSIAGLTL
jgi:purine-nucleoside phosphorylase